MCLILKQKRKKYFNQVKGRKIHLLVLNSFFPPHLKMVNAQEFINK